MKKNKILFLMLILLPLLYNKVYANTWNYVSPNTGEEGGNQEGKIPEIDLGKDRSGNAYTCRYQFSINVSNNITTNTYDQDNNITNPNSLTPTEETLAGTAVKMEIYEEKTITWELTETKVIRTNTENYTCTGEYRCPCSGNSLISSIRGLVPKIVSPCYCQCHFVNNTCPKGCTLTKTGGTTSEITSGEYYNRCKTQAEEKVKEIARKAMVPSYIVKLQNPNEINANDVVNVYSSKCGSDGSKYSKCIYNYSIDKVCINAKTALVRYINGSGTCTQDELEIKKEGNKWPYFIPLDAKNNSDFFISISAAGKESIQSEKACKYVIDHYSNYNELIITSEEKQFTGNKTYDLKLAKQGCYLSSIIGIPVKQSFYNEENSKIRGYGSYYRPIDITDPFPNGLSKKSYWNGLINDKNIVSITDNSKITKTYDLANSFKELTYSIYNINTKSIREYNHQDKNFYTSWEDMKLDGTSTFIDKYLTRYNNHDYYKLGCGPANSNWEGCK